MKLNEMISSGKITADKAKMGYVGAYTYAEVISGYTSFYLGAKSVCPSVTMEVTFTGSWYDETAEKEAAQKLINNGCVLISQHADSMGAPTACEAAGVPNVSYNGSTVSACPNTFIVSSRIDWAPYLEYAIDCVKTAKQLTPIGRVLSAQDLLFLPMLTLRQLPKVHRLRLMKLRQSLKAVSFTYLIPLHSL